MTPRIDGATSYKTSNYVRLKLARMLEDNAVLREVAFYIVLNSADRFVLMAVLRETQTHMAMFLITKYDVFVTN